MLNLLKQLFFHRIEASHSLDSSITKDGSAKYANSELTIINTPSPQTHTSKRLNTTIANYSSTQTGRLVLKKRFFGVKLQEIRECDMSYGVPFILYRCVEALIYLKGKMKPHRFGNVFQENSNDLRQFFSVGTEIEGIFRIPGNGSKVRAYRNAFERGDEPNLGASRDVHLVATLFKSYLNELPEPLLTFKLYSRFIKIASKSFVGEYGLP
jgi:hypothetical protein